MTHHLTSNKQKEAESKRKPPSEPICCTTTGRSAANSLAQTIGAASLSTREAQVKSTASPPHLRERRSQPRSAAGEPTPPSAPQAGIFRSGPRATRFGAAALLSSLGCRSCCSQQRSSSSACRSRSCERACFSQAAYLSFLSDDRSDQMTILINPPSPGSDRPNVDPRDSHDEGTDLSFRTSHQSSLAAPYSRNGDCLLTAASRSRGDKSALCGEVRIR